MHSILNRYFSRIHCSSLQWRFSRHRISTTYIKFRNWVLLTLPGSFRWVTSRRIHTIVSRTSSTVCKACTISYWMETLAKVWNATISLVLSFHVFFMIMSIQATPINLLWELSILSPSVILTSAFSKVITWRLVSPSCSTTQSVT